jgi:hypothetical protein
MSSNPPMWRELSALTSVERSLGSGLSIVVTPMWSHDHVSLFGRSTLAAWNIDGRLTCPTQQQKYFSIKPCPYSVPNGTGGNILEKPGTTQTRIWLASHLIRAPNVKSGVHEFESPTRRELGALTKVERSLGSGLSTIYVQFHKFYDFWLILGSDIIKWNKKK